MSQEAVPAKAAVKSKFKLKLKGDEKALMYPGFGLQVTQDHIDGPNGETFINAFRKLDKKSGVNNFEKFVEEVK